MATKAAAAADSKATKMQSDANTGYSCLLAGATGLVGAALLKQLIQDASVRQITMLARRIPDLSALKQEHDLSKLRIIVGSFDDLETALEGVEADAVFCTLGTTIKIAKTREAFRKVDYDYPLALAKWAKRRGANQYAVVTAMGASSSSMFFYNRVKGELEEQLAKLKLPIVHVLQPSLLLGERPAVRTGESVGAWMSKGLPFMMVGPLRKYRPIQGEAVACAMKRVVGQAAAGNRGQAAKQTTTIQYYSSDKIAELAVHTTG